MRSFLSLLPAVALICSGVVGCAGVDSTEDEGVDQAAPRAPARSERKNHGAPNDATAARDAKVSFVATTTRTNTNAPKEERTEPYTGTTMVGDAGAGGGGGGGETAKLAPPVLGEVALALRNDGSLTITVTATDPNDLPMSVVYTGFTRGVNHGTTVSLSAADLATAALGGDGELDFTVEDSSGASASTSVWLDLRAIVAGSLGDSGATPPPVIGGVSLALRHDGSLTITVMATDPNDLAMSVAYTGFTRGVNHGTTVFLSAADLATAALGDDGELDFTIADSTGASASTSVWLDLDAIVAGSLGGSITPQSSTVTQVAP